MQAATLSGTGGVLDFYAYNYDGAGNRISSQINSAIQAVGVTSVNELTSGTSGGPTTFQGTLQNPATLTINGNPATVDSMLRFTGTAAVTTGSNIVTLSATDAYNQTTTRRYQVTVPAVSGSYGYGADGNLTSDGTRTPESY